MQTFNQFYYIIEFFNLERKLIERDCPKSYLNINLVTKMITIIGHRGDSHWRWSNCPTWAFHGIRKRTYIIIIFWGHFIIDLQDSGMIC